MSEHTPGLLQVNSSHDVRRPSKKKDYIPVPIVDPADPNALAAASVIVLDIIYRSELKKLRDKFSAEEVTQNTLLDTIEHFHRPGPFLAYAFKTASNRRIDFFRRESFRNHEPIDGFLEKTLRDPALSPEEDIEHRQQTEVVKEALTALTESQREVIQKRFYEDLSLEDTAQALDMTVGKVKALQHKAIATLRKKIDKKQPA